MMFQFFFFNDTATTEIYTYGHTLSLHDALPISTTRWPSGPTRSPTPSSPSSSSGTSTASPPSAGARASRHPPLRSEEHTSELQSLMRNSYAVFCLKKKHKHRQYTQHHTTKQKQPHQTPHVHATPHLPTPT